METKFLIASAVMGSSDDIIATIKAGYDFEGPCVNIGALVDGGRPVPEARIRIPVSMMNRHGLVAGATGTGKTVTLQLIVEQLSILGVPCFAADIKGDLTGLAMPGSESPKLTQRTESIGQDWQPREFPVELLRLADSGPGIPVRATITSFGPILLSKVLDLNDTQESSLGLVFHYADQAGLPLLDIKDLRSVVLHLTSPEGREELSNLGRLSSATMGVILRKLINFEADGGDKFFGEPEFDVQDLLRTTEEGLGVITLLELPELQRKPVLFSTFLMWVLAELFEVLPEVGDLDKPKLSFFFDEAHLLFKDASKAFLNALIQTVRLIRSKGVSIFFVTQTPKDVHEDVLAQLGSRFQHQLRAFTPNDAAALKATVKTYPRSSYDLEQLLQDLGIGEGVVTVMSEKGAPTPVAHTMMAAPLSRMGVADPDVIEKIISVSPLKAKYSEAIDRESAYEILAGTIERTTPIVEPASYHSEPATAYIPQGSAADEIERAYLESLYEPVPSRTRKPKSSQPRPAKKAKTPIDIFLESAARTLGSAVVRGTFGNRRRR